MTATAKPSGLTVRVFVPDASGGYIEWDDLREQDKSETRERVASQVRRARELRNMARTDKEHRAEVSKRVTALIGLLGKER